MKKQVPDTDHVAALHQRLRTSEHFKALRGNDKALHFLEWMVGQAKSPRAFCMEWDNVIAPAMRAMGSIAAQLERDERKEGIRMSPHTFFRLLRGKHIPLLGEEITHPQPLTVLICDFPKILHTIRWLRAAEREKDTFRFPEHCADIFPTLAERSPRQTTVSTMLEAIVWDVLRPLRRSLLRFMEVAREKGVVPRALAPHYLVRGLIRQQDSYDIDGYFGWCVRMEQKDVLSCFSREEQEHIATWALTVSSLTYGFEPNQHGGQVSMMTAGDYYLAFAPEDRFDHIGRTNRGIVSHGASCGYRVASINNSVFPSSECYEELRGKREWELEQPNEPLIFTV